MQRTISETLTDQLWADDDVLQELWFEASEMDAVPVQVDADVKIDEGVLVDIQENGERLSFQVSFSFISINDLVWYAAP